MPGDALARSASTPPRFALQRPHMPLIGLAFYGLLSRPA